MKKRIIIFLAISVALLTSCAREGIFGGTDSTGTTIVTFTPDFGAADGESATKAFADTPQIENLYLAVFNEGGKSLVEYVKAEPLVQADENGRKYSYTATLKTSSKPRVIHFIANAPEELDSGSDVDAVGALSYSFDAESWTGQDAYWGYLKLDNGICEETDPDFSSLESALSDVRLVRNFARIHVESGTGSDFNITRFWVSNFPDCSTAAPYNRNARRFETQYATYTRATTAMEAGYMGFCPASSGLVSISGLDAGKLDAISCAPAAAAYIYEREKPVGDPLCIIVGGTSTLSSEESFYKIDLRGNDGNYLPILRNFSYTVSIDKVSKVGEPTVEAALKSVSSGALDTDISLQGLKDLSNGRSRIAVSETEKVLFDSQPFELRYSFIPEISGDNAGTVVNKTLAQWAAEGYPDEETVRTAHLSYVTFGFEPGLSGNVINSYEVAENDEIDGYRKVSMIPVPTSDIVKTEVVTVAGHVWNAEKGKYETLQRTVNYQMRQRLNMVLSLTPDRIPMMIGTPINLTIGIEENLPKSIFTLSMKITSEQMTLTPANSALPISSELGEDGKPSFFITKSITWEEYDNTPSVMDADGILRKHFECPLKVNTSDFISVDESFGQGDRVLVSNENFNQASALFIVGNDNLNRFINPHSEKDYLVAGRPVDIIFGMTRLPSDGTVFVRMLGMEPVDTDALEYRGEYPEEPQYSVYEMAVSNKDSESFAVRSTPGFAEAYFQLFDDEFNGYAPAKIDVRTPGFSELRFNYNNLDYVVAGKQAKAMFHMDYLPLDDAKVTIHLKNAVPVDGTAAGITDGDGYTPYQIAVTDNDFEFPVMISPASEGETTAYFKLTADNYVNSAVSEANIQKLNFSNLKLINLSNTAANYVIGGRPARVDFTLDDMPSDNMITIRLTNLTLGSGMSGVSAVTDNGDGSYNLTVTGTHVILDVTPAVTDGNALYELTDTEFNAGNCSVAIRKLSFSNLKLVNVNDTDKNYVIGGKAARIQFTLEDLPANNDGKITLTLTNLILADPAAGSGFSSISGSDGVYELAVTGRDVTLDVTPVTGVTSATFSLTDDEFYDGECTTDVRKLSFTMLKFTINTGTDYLLAGDATSTISFNVDQRPEDGDVTVWIKNASVSGATAAGAAVDGFTPYVVDVAINKSTTIGITVNSTGFSTENQTVEFYVTDEEFTTSDTVTEEVKTRYTINWADVLIKSKRNTTLAAAANLLNVEVYRTDSFSGTPVWTLTTDGSGYAQWTSPSVNIDTGTYNEKYYFKFTDSIGEYRSDAVTLPELAAQTGATVECAIQVSMLSIASGNLKVTLNGSEKYEGNISWTTQSGYSGSFAVKKNSGVNTAAIAIQCTDSEYITFTYGSYSGSFTKAQVQSGKIDLK